MVIAFVTGAVTRLLKWAGQWLHPHCTENKNIFKKNLKNDVFVINSFSNLRPEDTALNGLDVSLLKHTRLIEWFFIRLSEKQQRILQKILLSWATIRKRWQEKK